MAFTAADLELIDRTEEVRIETSANGGPTHRTTIWAVVDGGHVFIRSYTGPDARWYREATANPDVGLWVGKPPLRGESGSGHGSRRDRQDVAWSRA